MYEYLLYLISDNSVRIASTREAFNEILQQCSIAMVLDVSKDLNGPDTLIEDIFTRVADTLKGTVCFIKFTGTDALGDDVTSERIRKYEFGLNFSIPFRSSVTFQGNKDSLITELTEFVAFHNRNIVANISQKNFKQLGSMNKNMLLAVLDTSNVKGKELLSVTNAATAIHTEIQDSLVIGILDAVKYAKYLKKYKAVAPCLLVVNMHTDSFYLYNNRDIFDNQQHLISTLREASTMLPHADDEDESTGQFTASTSLPKRMNSLHKHIKKLGFLKRIQKKFSDYYPYSLLLCLAPVLFFAFSASMSNPRNKKGNKKD